MFVKHTYVNEKEFDPKWLPKDLESHGRFNDLPTPHREIEWHEYVHKVGLASSIGHEYRQIKLPDTPGVRSAYITWHGSFGLVVILPNKWTLKDRKTHYEEPARFFIVCEYKTPEWVAKHGTE